MTEHTQATPSVEELNAGSRVESIVASDGERLVYRRWTNSHAAPRGIVVALHGIQSHSGWYGWSGRRLSEAGFDVLFFDRRGSGLSTSPRGHAEHADRLLNDVVHALKHARSLAADGAMVTLLGLSWGGRLAAAVASLRPELLDQLVLLYPALRPRVRPTVRQRFLLRLGMSLGKSLRPVRIPLDDAALFTREPVWQQFINADALAAHESTVGFLSASSVLEERLTLMTAAIPVPTLLMLSGDDPIIDNAATREMAARLCERELLIRSYPFARHTLEFEPERVAYMTDLIAWLTADRRDGNVGDTF